MNRKMKKDECVGKEVGIDLKDNEGSGVLESW